MKPNKKPAILPGIRNIAISGRIGAGKSTLALHLANSLGWHLIDAGKMFRKVSKDMGIDIKHTDKIPEKLDREYEQRTLDLLKNGKNNIVQSHMSGYLSQGIKGVFKILVVCEKEGEDKQSIRIDRLMNRDQISAQEAKSDISQREESLVNKFRRLYVSNDKTWVYWDRKYYDLVVNTFSLNQKEALDFVLKNLNYDV